MTDDRETELPLSYNQEFLCLFDQGNDAGPFGPRYNIVHASRVYGGIDVETLRLALDDLVVRHEVLRTTVVRDGEEKRQRIHPPSSPTLIVRDLADPGAESRDVAAERFVIDIDASGHSVTTLPHLHAYLGRFDDQEAVLALVVHHTATDGWSMQVLMRDLAVCYARRRGHEVAQEPASQYREFTAWQAENLADEFADEAREYWQDKLDGAGVLAVPTDHPRSAGLPKNTAIHRFLIPAEVGAATVELSRAQRSSPFMVLLAAFNVLMRELTGAEDAVVPVITSGRPHDEFNDTVGPIFNFVPFRTDLSGATTFREVLAATRATCIEAYSYEIPFLQIAAQAPELMGPVMQDTAAAVAIQVVQFPTVLDREKVGDLEYTEIRRRLVSQPSGEDIPDGALFTLDIDPAGEFVGRLGFNTNIYDEATMVDLVAGFERVLRRAVTEPDAPL